MSESLPRRTAGGAAALGLLVLMVSGCLPASSHEASSPTKDPTVETAHEAPRASSETPPHVIFEYDSTNGKILASRLVDIDKAGKSIVGAVKDERVTVNVGGKDYGVEFKSLPEPNNHTLSIVLSDNKPPYKTNDYLISKSIISNSDNKTGERSTVIYKFAGGKGSEFTHVNPPIGVINGEDAGGLGRSVAEVYCGLVDAIITDGVITDRATYIAIKQAACATVGDALVSAQNGKENNGSVSDGLFKDLTRVPIIP
ncbi:hypothetical protein JNM87_00200 [Candidatus Saccharibacteria bacterium]|nr:hypothetical protein [Candidatus Saccharibacteria bacterium]